MLLLRAVPDLRQLLIAPLAWKELAGGGVVTAAAVVEAVLAGEPRALR